MSTTSVQEECFSVGQLQTTKKCQIKGHNNDEAEPFWQGKLPVTNMQA